MGRLAVSEPMPRRGPTAAGQDGVRVWVAAALYVSLFLEAAMYSVLTPLLPQLSDSLGLSKAQAGILFSSYVVGYVAGVLVGWRGVVRVGLRRATAAAVVLFGACCIGFGVAGTYAAAVLLRFGAGLGGGLAWVAVLTWLMVASGPERRGRVLGQTFSVAVLGTLFGPVIGNASTAIGLLPVFAAVGLTAIATTAALPGSASAAAPLTDTRPVRTAQGRAPLIEAGLVMAVLAVTYGALLALMPLRLADGGVPNLTIGWLFAGSALISAVVQLLAGPAIDRVGAFPFSLVSSATGLSALVALAMSSGAAADALFVVFGMGAALSLGMPANAAAVSFSGHSRGYGDVAVTVLVLTVFSGGEAIGSLTAPASAELVSDRGALIALAALNALAMLLLLVRRAVWSRPRPGAA